MHTNIKGVTLLELMIVVVVVGILSITAYPAYRNYATRAQRTDAKAALLRIATAQEKFFLTNATYTTNLAAPPAGLGIATTDHGYYNIAVVAGAGGIGVSYTATATAPVGSGQYSDVGCRTFGITEAGTASATDSGGGDNTAECW